MSDPRAQSLASGRIGVGVSDPRLLLAALIEAADKYLSGVSSRDELQRAVKEAWRASQRSS